MNAEQNGKNPHESETDFPLEDRENCVRDAVALIGQSTAAPPQMQANGAALSQALSLAVIAQCLVDLVRGQERTLEMAREMQQEARALRYGVATDA
jgi:hypothetical protein